MRTSWGSSAGSSGNNGKMDRRSCPPRAVSHRRVAGETPFERRGSPGEQPQQAARRSRTGAASSPAGPVARAGCSRWPPRAPRRSGPSRSGPRSADGGQPLPEILASISTAKCWAASPGSATPWPTAKPAALLPEMTASSILLLPNPAPPSISHVAARPARRRPSRSRRQATSLSQPRRTEATGRTGRNEQRDRVVWAAGPPTDSGLGPG